MGPPVEAKKKKLDLVVPEKIDIVSLFRSGNPTLIKMAAQEVLDLANENLVIKTSTTVESVATSTSATSVVKTKHSEEAVPALTVDDKLLSAVMEGCYSKDKDASVLSMKALFYACSSDNNVHNLNHFFSRITSDPFLRSRFVDAFTDFARECPQRANSFLHDTAMERSASYLFDEILALCFRNKLYEFFSYSFSDKQVKFLIKQSPDSLFPFLNMDCSYDFVHTFIRNISPTNYWLPFVRAATSEVKKAVLGESKPTVFGVGLLSSTSLRTEFDKEVLRKFLVGIFVDRAKSSDLRMTAFEVFRLDPEADPKIKLDFLHKEALTVEPYYLFSILHSIINIPDFITEVLKCYNNLPKSDLQRRQSVISFLSESKDKDSKRTLYSIFRGLINGSIDDESYQLVKICFEHNSLAGLFTINDIKTLLKYYNPSDSDRRDSFHQHIIKSLPYAKENELNDSLKSKIKSFGNVEEDKIDYVYRSYCFALNIFPELMVEIMGLKGEEAEKIAKKIREMLTSISSITIMDNENYNKIKDEGIEINSNGRYYPDSGKIVLRDQDYFGLFDTLTHELFHKITHRFIYTSTPVIYEALAELPSAILLSSFLGIQLDDMSKFPFPYSYSNILDSKSFAKFMFEFYSFMIQDSLLNNGDHVLTNARLNERGYPELETLTPKGWEQKALYDGKSLVEELDKIFGRYEK